MRLEDLFNLVDEWVERGWCRPLDRAFARFLHQHQPDSPALVLLAALLVSHQLGRGHICLDLQAALEAPDTTLCLPPEEEAGAAQLPGKPSQLLAAVSLPAWGQSLRDSALVGGSAGNTPLVLNAGRLYLRRYYRYEEQVAENIRHRLRHRFDVPDNLVSRLDRLFDPLRSPRERDKSEVHWQSVAAAIAAQSAFSIISGGPGTGKTTTVVQLLRLLQEMALEQGKKLRIRLAAPTGKAAARLTESISQALAGLPEAQRHVLPAEAGTLHRLLGSRPDSRRFTHHEHNPLHVDLLVVDEASMIDLEIMASLLAALPVQARLILLGDKDQLASVEAGSVLGDLCRNADQPTYSPETVAWIQQHTGYRVPAGPPSSTALDQHIVVLRKSHRFGAQSGIGHLAHAVNTGDTGQVAAAWDRGFADIARLALQTVDDEAFARLVLDGAVAPGLVSDAIGDRRIGYRGYLELVAAGPRADQSEEQWLQLVLDAFGRFQLLAAVRKGDWGVDRLNRKTAEVLHGSGLISRTEGWYAGRPVLVTRNDYSLGLMNGDIGIVLAVRGPDDPGRKDLRVVFPMADGTLKKVLPSRLNPVETVYAMTVHKSQGSEFEHAVLVLPDSMSPVLTRELVYTGITRARRWFTLVSPRADMLPEAVHRRTHRASGLKGRLGHL